MKNREIIACINAINEMEETPLPVALAYKLNIIHGKLMAAYEAYLKTLRPISDDNEKVMELLEMEADIDIEKIDKNELLDSGINLTLKALSGLSPVLEE